MKKTQEKGSLYIRIVSTVVICILCFTMGFGVCYYITKDTKSAEWKKFEIIYSVLTEKWFYADKIEDLDTKLMEQAIGGMTYLEEDLHTNYFSLENAKQFSSTLEGSNIGVGFSYYVNEDDNFTVKKTFVNSPADIAGLQKDDIITAVDDLECSENDSSDIVTYIKSNENNALKIKYIRDGKNYETEMIPTSYDATVSCTIEETYGIIALTSFSEYSAKEFDESIHRIEKAGIKNLIIDLRNNTGGYLKSVLDISSSLLPKDSVVFIENNKDGSQTKEMSSNKYSQVKMDSIVVIQNKDTASASEVLIGALKDNLKTNVITVGCQSYGKGTEQVSTPFSDGTSLKYTIAEWVTPNNTSINLVGFTPDYEVKLDDVQTVKYAKMEEDEVIKADSVHINAAAIQTYLGFLGYDVDRNDEYFSPLSSQSLAKFQSDYGLKSTGDCDKETWETLKDATLLLLNKKDIELDHQLNKAIELVK